MEPALYFLTCVNESEATKITQSLLENALVACVKQTEVVSSFWWEGKINTKTEILLVMDSVAEKFSEINNAIRQLHSYEQYVLTLVPITETNEGTMNWLAETIR